jgi:hypothetical protein
MKNLIRSASENDTFKSQLFCRTGKPTDAVTQNLKPVTEISKSTLGKVCK